MPFVAAADSPKGVAPEDVFRFAAQVLDDQTLSGVRGRGSEGVQLTGPGEMAVILWDEMKRQKPGRQGSHYSRSSTGRGNVQSGTLTLNGFGQ